MEKYQQMKSFISAAVEYSKHPSETAASVLQENLTANSTASDASIFDPRTSIATEFYVSLHELMTSLGSRTTLIWSAVDVLQNACRNPAARKALIHTYKFAPILAGVLQTNITSEKKVRVLKLLQELTYGIKISWQETHLPNLISILTHWVMQSKEEVEIALSLGVLVNLCYKNLPAVYTLMRTVNTKEFIKALLKLQHHSASTRVQSLKLLIVLEYSNTSISEKHILEFAAVTFSSLVTAMKQNDILSLRHIIDFFNDVGQNKNSYAVLLTYADYGRDTQKVLQTLKDDASPECASLVMEFLLCLVKLKVSALVPLYPKCVRSAVRWVPVEQVCSKALAVIKMILIDSRRTKTSSEVLAEVDVSVLMLIIEPKGEESTNGETGERIGEAEEKLAELMQLFHEIIKTPSLRAQVMQSFSELTMRRLLSPILDLETSSGGEWPGNLLQNPAKDLYIHALALTADMANHNSQWLTLYSELLRCKEIQMTMALGLITGDCEIKQKILQLTSTVGFSQECISAVTLAMKQLEPLLLVQNPSNLVPNIGNKTSINATDSEMTPLFSFAQEQRLDTFLTNLESAYESNQIQDITTSAVMELYEYKLAAMRHAERAMQSSLEAANKHGTSLQHRLSQVIAESSRLHQLLFDTQKCLEGTKEENKKAVLCKKQELETLKKIVSEKSANIEHLNTLLAQRLKEFDVERTAKEAEIAEIRNKNHELSKLLHKMQDTLNKKEQVIELKSKEIESKNTDISALKQEIQQLMDQIRKYEHIIAEKEQNVQKLKAELMDFSRMRDMIFELTAKKKDDPNPS